MSESEVAKNFAAVLEQIQRGVEIVVERNDRPVALIKTVQPVKRTLSELIRLAEQREKERGYGVTLDEDFAEDVERIVCERNPWTPRSWE